MKKSLLSVLVFLCWGISLSAREAPVVKTYFEGETITGLEIAGLCDVVVQQGDRTGVDIEVAEAPFMAVKCILENGILKLSYWEDAWWERREGAKKPKEPKERPLKATVTLSRLDRLSVDNVSRVWGIGTFTCDTCTMNVESVCSVRDFDIAAAKFALHVSSAAKVVGLKADVRESADIRVESVARVRKLYLYAPDVSVNAEGVARLYGFGEADNLKVQMEGCAKANMKRICVKRIDCRLTGISKLKCLVTDKAVFNAGSGSKISYKGSPEVMSESIRKID